MNLRQKRIALIAGGLVKEGKGEVAQGRIRPDGSFAATEVLARHDENYMPAEARHAIDEAQKTAPTYKTNQTRIKGNVDQVPNRPRIRSGAGYSGERRYPEEPRRSTPAFAGETAYSVFA